MRVWCVGDSGVRAQAAAFADSLAIAEFVDTSVDACIPEHVWTEQIHDARVRRQVRLAVPVIAVLYLQQPDYDSEATVIQVRRCLPGGSRIIAVVPDGVTPDTLDGFTHEAVIPISVVPFGVALT